MNYSVYKTFFTYLLSNDSKSKTYESTKLYLTNANYNTFIPERGDYSLYYQNVSSRFLNINNEIKSVNQSANIMNTNSLKNIDIISNNNEDIPSDITYEELLNTPCLSKAHKSPFMGAYINQAKIENEFNVYSNVEEEDLLKSSFGFKNHFDQEEYDKYSVPVTPLNGDTTCITADGVIVSARDKFAARGALLTVQKDLLLYPIGYIDFTNESYYNQYIFNWTNKGLISIK